MTDALTAVLERSRALGFLGPGEVAPHVQHASAFAAAWAGVADAEPTAFLDLGSGGGLPGLVLTLQWPTARCVLLDAQARRCRFLEEAVEELGVQGRCEVVQGRAESLARRADLAGAFPLVVARSFGAPATVAECAVGYLAPGGHLLVAEPPDPSATAARWPAEGLARLGLGPAEVVEGSASLVRITKRGPSPAAYPRRDGVPARKPLF